MSKKKAYMAKYSIVENGKEYPREFPVKGVKNKSEAEKKLRQLCTSPIIITGMEEII